MRRVFILVSACTFLLANALQTVAVYQCSMTGKRTWMRCCCAPASAAMDARAGACGHCESLPESRHPGNGLTRPCCKVTYDKATPKTLPAATSFDSGWKKALSDGRLVLAALPPILPEAALPGLELLPPGAESGAERSAPPPLFLLHCVFLI